MITGYRARMEFGFSLVPTADLTAHQDLVAAAEADGLDLVGVQDHPYAPALVDTFALIPYLLAHTSRIRVFPDVASLPLRPAAMLAQTSASLDVLSGGRFELGLGAGGNWAGIESLGVPRLTAAAALDAQAEAISVLRALWQPGEAHVPGSVRPLRTGPGPAHPINIWIGSQGPRSLRLTGRLGDGWAAPIPSYLPYEEWPTANTTIDEAARAAGRDPAEVLRMAQLVGTITDEPGDAEARTGATPVRGTPDQWAALIARLATEQPFRTFIFWPEQSNSIGQVTRFAREVVPAARALLPA
jgi:alkanesulfonate monooxygenase SsuD/methylene tetrahydromethanopterin reductase-like flavin-dependent oxidoreductase (luciferase family)